jgi:hypothetical protein
MSRKPNPIKFEDLPDRFGARLCAKFLGCGTAKVYMLLKNFDPIKQQPIDPRGEFIPHRKLGSDYVIIKRVFGLTWGFTGESEQTAKQVSAISEQQSA